MLSANGTLASYFFKPIRSKSKMAGNKLTKTVVDPIKCYFVFQIKLKNYEFHAIYDVEFFI